MSTTNIKTPTTDMYIGFNVAEDGTLQEIGGLDLTGTKNMPKIDIPQGTGAEAQNTNFLDGIMDIFSSDSTTAGADKTKGSNGVGSTLQGIAAVAGALASIYGVRQQKKYQDEMLSMEKARVQRNVDRQNKAQAEYEKVWGNKN